MLIDVEKLSCLGTCFYHVKLGFMQNLQSAIHNLDPAAGVFTGDQLFTFHRNLSFLQDEKFMAAVTGHAKTEAEKNCIWRMAVLVWAARHAVKLEGDFVEAACYRGTTARIICDTIDFAKTDKTYYLYDLFDHDDSMPHHSLEAHSETLFQEVKNRFSDVPNVKVTQGKIPDVLKIIAPEKIALMHVDLNNADAEIGALECLFERMVPGAILVFDDYGWLSYRQQKLAEDKWLGKRGYFVLELPTGQGLVLKWH